MAIATSDNMTGTSTSTPTTVASAAPEFSLKRLMATATANFYSWPAAARAAWMVLKGKRSESGASCSDTAP